MVVAYSVVDQMDNLRLHPVLLDKNEFKQVLFTVLFAPLEPDSNQWKHLLPIKQTSKAQNDLKQCAVEKNHLWQKGITCYLPPVCRETDTVGIFEQRHEKTCLYHMRTTKAQISLPR